MAQRVSKRQSKAKQADLGLDQVITALYIRVSTEKQATEGYGLDAQRSELDTYCAAHGWTVTDEHIYIDRGISGKSTDRPAFQAMLQAAQEGRIQRIIATKLDRIARNLKDLLNTVDQLESAGCALVIKKEQFDTSTAQGRFMLQMLGAVSELERSMIGERVHSGRVEKAKQGGYNGSKIPYGYTYSAGVFVVNRDQATVIRDIFEGFVRGESMASMADCLNVNETPTATGGKWYASTVRYILTNGLYAGLAQWYADGDKEDSKIVVEGAYPAIIDRALYDAAHKRLQALRPGRQSQTEIDRRLAHPERFL